MNRDDDDDNNRRGMSVWFIAPCCCFGLAALIWLIILQVQVNSIDHRLDTLIRSCAGTCGASATVVGGAAGVGRSFAHGNAVKPASHNSVAKAHLAAPLQKRNVHEEQQVVKKKHHHNNNNADAPIDVAATGQARWARVGDAKKPTQRVQ